MQFISRKLVAAALLGLVVACAAATSAPAQQSQQQQPQYQQQPQPQYQQQPQQFGQQQGQMQPPLQQQMRRQGQPQFAQQGQQQMGQQGQPWQLRPTGWIRIAADYDGDGQYDAVEYIFAYDLQQAQETSRGRQQPGQMVQQAQQAPRSQQPAAPTQRLEGAIQELVTTKLVGQSDPHQLARIRTPDGRTAKVDLGPQSKLRQLDLQKGDQVTIIGRRGTINDRAVLIAYQVQSQDQQVRIQREPQDRLRRIAGELVSHRTTRVRGLDGPQVVGTIRLDQGRTLTAILGPEEKLQDVDLQQGDRVTLLARRIQLDNQPTLVAHQLRANNETVQLELEGSRRFERRSSDESARRLLDRLRN